MTQTCGEDARDDRELAAQPVTPTNNGEERIVDPEAERTLARPQLARFLAGGLLVLVAAILLLVANNKSQTAGTLELTSGYGYQPCTALQAQYSDCTAKNERIQAENDAQRAEAGRAQHTADNLKAWGVAALVLGGGILIYAVRRTRHTPAAGTADAPQEYGGSA